MNSYKREEYPYDYGNVFSDLCSEQTEPEDICRELEKREPSAIV